MKKIKVAIIGAGQIAAKHLDVLSRIKNIELYGITSKNNTNAKKLKNRYGITAFFISEELMISDRKIDAFLILVSEKEIFNITKKIIKTKKPFFVEKPIGLNLKESKYLSNLSTKYKSLNIVGFNRRHYSIFHKGIKLIKKHGKLLSIHIEGHERIWKIKKLKKKTILDSWLFINSIHTLDLLRFFGGEVKNINLFKTKIYEKHGDQFVSIFKFNNNTLGSYISNWNSPGGWSITLFGEGITVKFKPLEKGYYYLKSSDKEFKIRPSKYDLVFKEGFYNQMISFTKMIKDNKVKWPSLDIQGAVKSIEIVNQFYKK